MKIDTTKIDLATQTAGQIPAGATVIGIVTESDDCYCRNWSALVRMPTGIYVTMIDSVIRNLDPAIARRAVFAALVEDSGLSQAAVAEYIGVDKRTVERWLGGQRGVPQHAINALERRRENKTR